MDPIEKRKEDHIKFCLEKRVQHSYNFWDDIVLKHVAIPNFDFEDIETKTAFLGKKLGMPLIFSSMVGGCRTAKKINENLAKVAERFQIGMGVGSERVILKRPDLKDTFAVVKDYDIPLVFANIGAPQIVEGLSKEDIETIMATVEADYLFIHLNYLQEVIQPEGDTKAKGLFEKISELSNDFPIVIKETGAGIGKEVALRLRECGVKGIDVAGVSGTSWAGVEYYRAKGIEEKEMLGKMFWDWGIPSPICVLECKNILPLIASGGIRNGLDIARAIALGADIAAIAGSIFPFTLDESKLEKRLEIMKKELEVAMFLTGSKTVNDLKRAKFYIIGKCLQYLQGESKMWK